MSNPNKTYRYGSVSASVWFNAKQMSGEMVQIPTIKFSKAYKPADNSDWKFTNSFDAEDLLKVARLAEEVYRDLRLKGPNSDTSQPRHAEGEE